MSWLTRGFSVLVSGMLCSWLVSTASSATAAASPGGWTAATRLSSGDVVPGMLLVTTDSPEAAARLAAGGFKDASAAGANSARRLAQRTALVTVTAGQEAEAAEALGQQPGVVAVEPNLRLEPNATPNDPKFPRQWAHRITDAQQAWDTTTGSASVIVAVLDTGIDGRHPEFRDRIVERVDASTGSVRQGTVDNDACKNGHGTQVAGVIGAAGNNGASIAGVNWTVSILDIALFSLDGDCEGATDAALIAGLDYVANGTDRKVNVVNMSVGRVAGSCPNALQAVVDAVRARGITLVAAAGNHEDPLEGATQIPASCNGVISVGATGADGKIAHYSTTNQWVDLVAPGGDDRDGSGSGALILTTTRNGKETVRAGTSYSSPYVAGVAALLLAQSPSLSPNQIEAALEGGAADQGPAGWDNTYGWGLVQADKSMQLVVSGQIPALQPDPPFPVGGR